MKSKTQDKLYKKNLHPQSLKLLTRHIQIFLKKKVSYLCLNQVYMNAMHPSAFQNVSSLSVWQRLAAKGCWVIWRQAKGLWKLSCLNGWCTVPFQMILLPAPYLCLICTHTRVKLPHPSLISECLNLRCGVERLPTDTQPPNQKLHCRIKRVQSFSA